MGISPVLLLFVCTVEPLHYTDTSISPTVHLVQEKPELIHFLPLEYRPLYDGETQLWPFGVLLKEARLYFAVCFTFL